MASAAEISAWLLALAEEAEVAAAAFVVAVVVTIFSDCDGDEKESKEDKDSEDKPGDERREAGLRARSGPKASSKGISGEGV